MVHSQLTYWKGRFGIGVPPSTGAKEGLQWLLLGRLLGLYLLFGAGILPRFFSPASIPVEKLLDGYLLIGAAFLSILVQSFWIERLGKNSWAAIANLALDTSAISLWLLWHPESSLFVLMYLVQILLVALTFFQRGALLAAVAASVGFGVVNFLGAHEAGYFAWMIYTALFMLVGLVGGYLSEELLRTTERLREKTKRVAGLVALQEKILSSLPTGLLTLDGEGVVHFANPAACHILKRTSEELSGQKLSIALPELMPFVSQIESVVLKEDTSDGELPVDVKVSQSKDDSHRSYFVESQTQGNARLQQIVELGQGRDRRILRGDVAELNTGDAYAGGLLSQQAKSGRVLLFQDVTKLIHLEDKLKQHEKLAAVGQLAAGIAHEIRNPLASMSASIEMLRDGDTTHLEGPESHKLMDIAIREIDRLNLLITEFLDFVKPDKMTLEAVGLSGLLQEVLTSVQAGQGTKQQITFKTSFDAQAIALASNEKIRQVVWNFLINSIQAIAEEGTIEIGCSTAGNGRVRFWVQDSGMGMGEETLAHLFEPFFTTKQRGTGLGLATAYKIVEAHQGEIRVESAKGKGTRFEVLLPRA